ncbi:MAG: hypothetical protein RMJ67_07445 [Elusimicrobiota bacterium]|nr:hypothetical protein [Endomicrobiia bacterium]MCX7641302.1 hypothetical protein [Elusimicrobiales bacterium]MDW8166326.1 hypothetical protein [Elusimicrobiota bacterium]
MLKLTYICIALLYISLGLSSELPKGLIDIYLGQSYKNLKQKYQIKKIASYDNISKTYEVIYTDNSEMRTLISFFNSKVFKITLIYSENFLNDTEWESIYNQAIINYGIPTNIYLEKQNNTTKEHYIWEDENLKHTYVRIIEDGKLRNFYIILTDKKIEEKINNLSPLKKLYYKIVGLF